MDHFHSQNSPKQNNKTTEFRDGESNPGRDGLFINESDTWTKRVDKNFRDPFGLQFTDNPLTKKRKYTDLEVTAFCLNQGLDPTLDEQRNKARRTAQAEEVGRWMQEEKDRRGLPSARQALSDITPTLINTSTRRPPTAMTKSSHVISGASLRGQDGGNAVDGTDIPGDNEDVGSIVGSADGVDIPETMEEAVMDQVTSPVVGSQDIVVADGIQFVRWFSTINVIKTQSYYIKSRPQWRENHQGNSRDEPTPFLFYCTNASLGCTFTSPVTREVGIHELSCKITVAASTDNDVQCTWSGCSATFDSIQQRSNHIQSIHKWTPRACEEDSCDSTIVFQLKSQYRRHMDEHKTWEPMTCRYPGCVSTTLFKKSTTYDRHLQTVHKLVGEYKDLYRPQVSQFVEYVPQKCSVEGCTAGLFETRKKLVQHLTRKHGLVDKEEREAYLPAGFRATILQ